MKESFMDLNFLYKKIFEAVSVGGIQNIAETASLVCGQPVVITDAAFHVLGISPKSKQNEDIWDIMLEKGYAPQEMVMCFYNEKYMEFANSSHESTLVNWGPLAKKPRVMTPVLIKGAVEGYVGMLCSNELYNASYDEAVRIIAKAVAIAMEGNTEIDISNNPLAKVFISDLFRNLILTNQRLNDWQSKLGLNAKMDFRLIGIKPSNAAGHGILKYLLNSTLSSFPNQISIIIENTLYLLLFSSSKGFMEQELKIQLNSILKSFNAYCGISRSITDLLKFDTYRQQVDILLNVVPRLYSNQNTFEYDHYSLESILSVTLDHLDYENYSAPEINLLKRFDRENSTVYLESLRVYLQLMGNSKDASKALNIHRNTLLYRIHKIEDILSIDLTNSDLFIRLLLSFRLIEMHACINKHKSHTSLEN